MTTATQLSRALRHVHRLGLLRLTAGSLWALFAISFGRLLGVRLAVIDARNIGHLALYPDIAYHEYLRRFGEPNWRFVFWEIIEPVSNSYLLSLWLGRFQIRCSHYGVRTGCGILRKLNISKFTIAVNQYVGDINDALYDTAPPITPFQEDIAKVSCLLRSHLGLESTSRIVCLHIRDETYDLTLGRIPREKMGRSQRNGSIENFIKSIDLLCESGFTVVLMGTHKHASFAIKHRNFFDLQTLPIRSEMLDVVLIYLCKFFWAGSVSGLYEVAGLFRKPTLFTNYFPLYSLPVNRADSLVMPKFLQNKQSLAEATLPQLLGEVGRAIKEMRGNLYFNHDLYQDSDLNNFFVAEENANLDLLTSVQEFLHLLASNFNLESSMANAECQFLDSLPTMFIDSPKRIRVATAFLQRYKQDLYSINQDS